MAKEQGKKEDLDEKKKMAEEKRKARAEKAEEAAKKREERRMEVVERKAKMENRRVVKIEEKQQQKKERQESVAQKLVTRLAKMAQKRKKKVNAGPQSKKGRNDSGVQDEEEDDDLVEDDELHGHITSSDLLHSIALQIEVPPQALAIMEVGRDIDLHQLGILSQVEHDEQMDEATVGQHEQMGGGDDEDAGGAGGDEEGAGFGFDVDLNDYDVPESEYQRTYLNNTTDEKQCGEDVVGLVCEPVNSSTTHPDSVAATACDDATEDTKESGTLFVLYNCSLEDIHHPVASDVVRNLALLEIHADEESLVVQKKSHWKAFLKREVFVLEFTATPELSKTLLQLLHHPEFAGIIEAKNVSAYGEDVTKHLALATDPSRDRLLSYSFFFAGATVIQNRKYGVRFTDKQIEISRDEETHVYTAEKLAFSLKLAKEVMQLVTRPAEKYINKLVSKQGMKIF